MRGCAAELPGTRGSPTTRGFVSKGGVSVVCFQGRVTVSEGLLAVQVLDGLLRWGRAAGEGCVEVHRQRAVAGNTRLLLWCRCWYRGTHVGAVVVLCIRSEEAAARCDLAVCVSLHVWSAGYHIGNEGCASVCTALEQNKTLTSFTLGGMLCSGVCSVQVIGVLWCKCSGAVITGRSFSRLPFGSGYCALHYGILHCSGVPGPCHLRRPPTLLQRFCPLPPHPTHTLMRGIKESGCVVIRHVNCELLLLKATCYNEAMLTLR